MSHPNDVQEFGMQPGSWALLPQPSQPPFRQTYMPSTINDNANGNAQELLPCPSGASTRVNNRLRYRRIRQRERRSQARRQRYQNLGQEVINPELEWDQFSQQAVNVAGYGQQGPEEEQYLQPQADFYMPVESSERDVYFP